LDCNIILVALLAISFLIIAKNASSSNKEYALIQKDAYRLRGKLFIIILLVIIPVIGYTLMQLPYPTERITSQATKTVKAIGHQWYWEISDLSAKVGEPVMYNVTSADVNHGFGVYDEELNVVAQTQAMPGYINNLLVAYPKPGKYRILCLEYCGLAHHAMIAEIIVTE